MLVTMLTKPHCVQCRMTVKELDKHGIEYKTIDITESEAALEWCRERDLLQAPVLIVGDMSSEDYDAWTGFRPDKIVSVATRMNGSSQ